MDKETESYQNNLIVRNYSLENVPGGSPGKLFVNPTEIFVMKTNADGSREFSLWNYSHTINKSGSNSFDRPFVRVATLMLADDETTDAHELLKTLKTSATSIEVTKVEPLQVDSESVKRKIVVRYLSSDELASLLRTVIEGYAEAGEIIATDATTVPLDASEAVVDASELLAEYAEQLSTSAKFDVTSKSATSETQEEASRPRPTLQQIEDEDEPEYVDPSRLKKKKSPNYLLLALFAVVALVIAWWVVSFLPTWLPDSDYSKGEEMVIDDAEPAVYDTITSLPVEPEDTVEIADATASSQAALNNENADTEEKVADNMIPEDEKADIAYLNSHKVWTRSELKSEKYRGFYDSFSQGSISKLAQSEYFAKDGLMQNPDAEKVIDLLWGANGTGTQASNEKQLKRLKGKNKIDLHEFYETLARYRDKNPNTSPRPKN